MMGIKWWNSRCDDERWMKILEAYMGSLNDLKIVEENASQPLCILSKCKKGYAQKYSLLLKLYGKENGDVKSTGEWELSWTKTGTCLSQAGAEVKGSWLKKASEEVRSEIMGAGWMPQRGGEKKKAILHCGAFLLSHRSSFSTGGLDLPPGTAAERGAAWHAGPVALQRDLHLSVL